jgi:hypothetical protein
VNLHVSLEFDDKDDLPTPDVDEALSDAIKNMKKVLVVLPPIKGNSSRGKQVSFRVKDVELA